MATPIDPRDREPVSDPRYWAERLRKCGGEVHRAVFNGSADQFSPIQQDHRVYLARAIGREDSVLDAGCGYGRILDFLPREWKGRYLGVDVSPDLIALANVLHKGRMFWVADLLDLGDVLSFHDPFDHAIVCSVRPMIVRHLGQDVWDRMEVQINKVARRTHYLTYREWD